MLFRINIILMLSTIIPDLDCCSSFKILNRKSIHLYPAATSIELSIHKSMQFQQNHHYHHLVHQQQQKPQSPPPPALSSMPQFPTSYGQGHEVDREEDADVDDGKAQTSFWQKYFKLLDFNKNKNPNTERYTKLNRSLWLDIQNQEDHLEHRLINGQVSITTEAPAVITTTESPQDQNDIQYKLISEIVSLECVDILKLEFCLNGGRCFLYPILNHSLSSCECAEGFVGERCEAKSYEFIPRIRPRIVLAKTKGGPLVYGIAVVDILFLLFLFCKNYNRD